MANERRQSVGRGKGTRTAHFALSLRSGLCLCKSGHLGAALHVMRPRYLSNRSSRSAPPHFHHRQRLCLHCISAIARHAIWWLIALMQWLRLLAFTRSVALRLVKRPVALSVIAQGLLRLVDVLDLRPALTEDPAGGVTRQRRGWVDVVLSSPHAGRHVLLLVHARLFVPIVEQLGLARVGRGAEVHCLGDVHQLALGFQLSHRSPLAALAVGIEVDNWLIIACNIHSGNVAILAFVLTFLQPCLHFLLGLCVQLRLHGKVAPT
mmetsp:Transcript_3130/g.6694  ORF Transcript_3130/g.6694 Transcript_3130/m.6694 type:complete len:264 (-) Transcript_3130:2312-3103(-)